MLEQLSKVLKKEIRRMYGDPETAFSSFNFGGQMAITIDEFLRHAVVAKIGYDAEDVRSYLLRDKIFPNANSEINFQ